MPAFIDDASKKIHHNFIGVVDKVIEYFKTHKSLSFDLTCEKVSYNKKVKKYGPKYALYHITANFLPCLREVCDHNADYFTYTYKKRSPSFFIGKITMKQITQDSFSKLNEIIFDMIVQSFRLLTIKNNVDGLPPAVDMSLRPSAPFQEPKKVVGELEFHREYIEYVKEMFGYKGSKEYPKMIMMIDQVKTQDFFSITRIADPQRYLPESPSSNKVYNGIDDPRYYERSSFDDEVEQDDLPIFPDMNYKVGMAIIGATMMSCTVC